MENEEKRMLGDYEVRQSIHIGKKEVVFGVNEADKYPFMVCFCTYDNPFSLAWATEAVGTDDYLEAMQIFTDRVQAQIEVVKEEQSRFDFDMTPFTKDDCIPDNRNESIVGKVVVINTELVREINTEYDAKLDETKNGTAHDVLEMSGSRAVWKEVLAVYSVKTNTDPDNPQEVATMDDSKKELLKNIFWEMNEISSRTESKTETQITESDDGHGNIIQTETTVTRTYLYITVAHKTAEEMADKYNFNADQREQLSELLAEENNSLWSQVLYGISGGDSEIVNVALSQVGNIGGQPYWSWYGFEGRVEWCACFVSWCANECGYIDTGVIPKFAGCVLGSQWFMDRGQWQDGSFEPSAGHIIFFDWEGDGVTDHVGIVERVENGTVYTVEGNSGDTCRQNRYAIGSSVIYGYGIPAY